MSIISTFLSFLTPHLFRITIDLLILALVVMCFCSALYLVTEIRVPESTFEQCKKLNEIAHLEWVFNLTLGFSFVVCRYFFCGFLTFPIGMWHLFKYTQRGNEIFHPIEIHRKNVRDKHITFYTAKLTFYTILFLTVMIYVGFGVLDYVLQLNLDQLFRSHAVDVLG